MSHLAIWEAPESGLESEWANLLATMGTWPDPLEGSAYVAMSSSHRDKGLEMSADRIAAVAAALRTVGANGVAVGVTTGDTAVFCKRRQRRRRTVV
jgi:hypothetical protein